MIAEDTGRCSAGRAGSVALLLQHSAAALRERTGPLRCVARPGCGRPGAGAAGGAAAVSGVSWWGDKRRALRDCCTERAAQLPARLWCCASRHRCAELLFHIMAELANVF